VPQYQITAPARNTSGDAEHPATQDEIKAAALQYIRKVSGYRLPSRANQVIFEQAVAQVAAATQTLLEGLANPIR
jgi:hypothetical protein